jgi:hypothetical protein
MTGLGIPSLENDQTVYKNKNIEVLQLRKQSWLPSKKYEQSGIRSGITCNHTADKPRKSALRRKGFY